MVDETPTEQTVRLTEKLMRTMAKTFSGDLLRKNVLFDLRGVVRVDDDKLFDIVQLEYDKNYK
jgi:hypothetical protein